MKTKTVPTTELIELWLHGRSPNTVTNYRRYVNSFLAHSGKTLSEVTLADIQLWQLTLKMSPASVRTALAVIKSLLSFGHSLGALPLNVGKLVRLPKVKDSLAERILSVEEVKKIISSTESVRDRLLLRLLYSAGLRVSELCDLKWRDLKPRHKGGQMTVFGKGGKTRVIMLSDRLWQEIFELSDGAGANDPVFRSRQRNKKDGSYRLSRKQVHRIVREAAKKAGIEGNVGPHWFRHSHASHSLAKGAPINLVRDTLGHSTIAVTEKYLHVMPDDSSALYLDD